MNSLCTFFVYECSAGGTIDDSTDFDLDISIPYNENADY